MEEDVDYMGEEIFDIFCKNDACIDDTVISSDNSVNGISTVEISDSIERECSLSIEDDSVTGTTFLESSITDSRDRYASELESELADKHIHISGDYKFDSTHGGFDRPTGQKIHEAIDRARGEELISDYTYKKLIDKLDDACYYQ